MKIRFIALAAAALMASSAALAVAPAPVKVAEPQPAPRAQILVEELARGAREILAAAVPEIALPKLELKLPTQDGGAR